jgi:hypothetical protein
VARQEKELSVAPLAQMAVVVPVAAEAVPAVLELTLVAAGVPREASSALVEGDFQALLVPDPAHPVHPVAAWVRGDPWFQERVLLSEEVLALQVPTEVLRFQTEALLRWQEEAGVPCLGFVGRWEQETAAAAEAPDWDLADSAREVCRILAGPRILRRIPDPLGSGRTRAKVPVATRDLS